MRTRDLATRVVAEVIELAHLAEDRANRRLLPHAGSDGANTEAWLRVAGAETLPGKLDTAFVVTTYRRPEACARLLAQLDEAIAHAPAVGQYAVLVLDDASPEAYAPTLADAAPRLREHLQVLRARRNHGKSGFWQVVQRGFRWAAEHRPALAFFLQDDIELPPTAVRDAIAFWREIRDADKTVLNLLLTADDEPGGRWIRFARDEHPARPYRRTGWFDLNAFLVGPRFWELTRAEVFPVHASRWRARPAISSRVGKQLTRRLWGRGAVYQVVPTLALHGGESSRMNPEARRERPFDNRPR